MLFFMLNKKMAGPQGNFSGQVQIFSQNPTSCSDFILRQPELTRIPLILCFILRISFIRGRLWRQYRIPDIGCDHW